jgi:hypothetical protein
MSDTEAGLSGYPAIKRTEVKAALSPEDQQEIERLESLEYLSLPLQLKLEALWSRAFALHVPPQVDPLVLYARELSQ